MMTLYHFPRSPDPTFASHRGVRSVRPRWLLEELGEPYELVNLDAMNGEHQQPEYLALNPNGTVPTFIDGDVRIFESAAICMYLADKFPEHGLAPAVGAKERSYYYQWLFYGVNYIETLVEAVAFHTWGLPPEDRSAEALSQAVESFQLRGQVLSQALEANTFLLGENFSAADVVLAQPFLWLEDIAILGTFPILEGYLESLFSRPAVKRAMTD